MAPSHMIQSHVPLYVATYLAPPMTCSHGTYTWPTHMATITYDPFSWHHLLTCTIMYDYSHDTITQHSNAQNFRACCISLAIADGVCHGPAHTRGPQNPCSCRWGPWWRLPLPGRHLLSCREDMKLRTWSRALQHLVSSPLVKP